MNTIHIKGPIVVTMNEKRDVYSRGHMTISGAKIVAVGPGDGKPPLGARIIDAEGMILIPGFVSTHNHLHSAVVRSIPYWGYDTEDYSFIAWLERFWFNLLEDKVDQDQIYAGTLANLLANIRTGVTTTFDTTEGSYALPGALEAAADAFLKSGIRGIISFETTERLGPEVAKLALDENLKLIDRHNGNKGMIEGRIGAHTTFTCSTELLQKVKRLAGERGCGIGMHLSDDRYHYFDTTRRFGKRPVLYLRDIGFLGPEVILFHCAYINLRLDPQILKETDTAVAHSAASTCHAGLWADMIPLLDAKVRVGFGLDGQTHSMFEVMRVSQISHRLKYETANALPDSTALGMATIGGAQALGKAEQIGSLEAGKMADVVLLHNRSTVPVFENNVDSYIVGTCERHDVETVIINGNIVLEDGKFVELNEKEIIGQCREQALRLWQKNNWPLPGKS